MRQVYRSPPAELATRHRSHHLRVLLVGGTRWQAERAGIGRNRFFPKESDLGAFGPSEFAPILRELAACAEVRVGDDCGESGAAAGRGNKAPGNRESEDVRKPINADWVPELVVVAQSWPGQVSACRIESLRQRYPLSRFYGLLSSLCEGEGRSGTPWPGVQRLYWHQFLPHLASQLNRIDRRLSPDWTLPVTATEEERLLASRARATSSSASVPPSIDLPADWQLSDAGPCNQLPSGTPSLIVFHTTNPDLESLLLAAAGGLGFAAARWGGAQQVAGAVAGIWDTSRLDGADHPQLDRFRRSVQPAPVLCLVDFARRDEWQSAQTLGIHRLLSKPFRLADLAAELTACCSLANQH